MTHALGFSLLSTSWPNNQPSGTKTTRPNADNPICVGKESLPIASRILPKFRMNEMTNRISEKTSDCRIIELPGICPLIFINAIPRTQPNNALSGANDMAAIYMIVLTMLRRSC